MENDEEKIKIDAREDFKSALETVGRGKILL
jgi:hypothetical protein